MKKAFFAFVLCLILAVSIAAVSIVSLYGSRDDVEVTALSQTGDPAAARGLTVTQTFQWDYSHFWTVTTPLDRPQEAATDFARDLDLDSLETIFPYHVFSISAPELSISCSSTDIDDFFRDLRDFPHDWAALESSLADILPQAPHGQTSTYALDLTLGQSEDVLPLLVRSHHLRAVSDASQFGRYAQAFTDFFAFPKPQDFTCTISVTLDKDGRLTDLVCTNNAPYAWETCAAFSDTDLWFSFYPEAAPDFSRTPGGLGLYHVDVVPGGLDGRLDLGSIANVYPLPADAQVCAIHRSEDGTTLDLTYRTAGAYRCDVLDAETYALLDTFALPFPAERDAGEWDDLRLYTGENYRLYLFREDFTLFAATEDGWAHAFTAPLDPIFQEARHRSHIAADWNGDTLALALQQDPYGLTEALTATGLTVQCFREGDVVWQGFYDTSLTSQDDAVLPSEYHPLSISWDT